jgi:hypothetical protein
MPDLKEKKKPPLTGDALAADHRRRQAEAIRRIHDAPEDVLIRQLNEEEGDPLDRLLSSAGVDTRMGRPHHTSGLKKPTKRRLSQVAPEEAPAPPPRRRRPSSYDPLEGL